MSGGSRSEVVTLTESDDIDGVDDERKAR